MNINRRAIKRCLDYVFGIYGNRSEDVPEISQIDDIERMKEEARFWNISKELKIALIYLIEINDVEILSSFINDRCDVFEDEYDDEGYVKNKIRFALSTDWSEVGECGDDILENLTFINYDLKDWKKMTEKERNSIIP
ncbi:hypothetical protein [Aureibacter tunicatorum]|uniref:Uncharacterized protein n=1 Tax=Aureibacter tunicatorum TaxID=866807 RepID=A0AAE3XTX4_9BACT|nr:hypothetical protein [Aureibacter tunicatorum]MDR6241920.1 hypothetical protein [Aureibacter tunicatorum]BDD07469.1 hypothetical protein AUTU_49520 [Aureibacter tunicatorum]